MSRLALAAALSLCLLMPEASAQTGRFSIADLNNILALENQFTENMGVFDKAVEAFGKLSGDNVSLQLVCYPRSMEETEIGFLWTMDVGDLVRILALTDTLNKAYGIFVGHTRQRLTTAIGALKNQSSKMDDYLNNKACARFAEFTVAVKKSQDIMARTVALLQSFQQRLSTSVKR